MLSSRVFAAVAALLSPAAPVSSWSTATTVSSLASSRARSSAVRAGLFDGVKDAFAKPSALQDADRVTPIDRWLGIDKDLSSPKDVKQFVDPQDASNYYTIQLAKPMGIKFLENEAHGGTVVDMLLPDGSASSTRADVKSGDQLVAVNGEVVMGLDFESALGAIQSAESKEVALVLFRGSEDFLYGPTQPSEEWLRSSVLN